jgi:non-haem Fe2+, alpha-ketoglutarate-dependent halogenase
MPKRLTDDQVRTYRSDGFVHPVRALDAAEAADYRRRFEDYERRNDGWYELSKGQKLHLLQTWMAELASNSGVLDAIEDVLGPDVMVWGTSLFVKDARDPAFVSWHQDSTYWGLSKPDVVTAWIALSPATRRSGCMKMIPGSFAWDQLPHRDTFDDKNLLTRGQEIAVEVNEQEAVFIELQPGEASLHNIRTVHGSAPNRSDDRRIGVAVRYIAPHVRQIYADRDSAWLVRGEDRYGHFIHETPPQRDMDSATEAEHARIMALRQDVLYKDVKGKPTRL